MPDETNPTPVVLPGAENKVLSPSPTPGAALPTRRAEDTASYSGEWSVLIGGILTWLSTFFIDMAAFESWREVVTPKFMALHVGQLAGVVAAIVAAKRIK